MKKPGITKNKIIDWKTIVQSWYEPFKDILEHQKMMELMFKLYSMYQTDTIYPNPKTIFRAFKECSYDNLKVVILGQDPYPEGSFTGIAFANENKKSSEYSPSLQKIKERILLDFYDDSYTDFDPTLLSWTEQGVLLLNSAMTVEKNKPGSHAELWKGFMHNFLKVLNKSKSNIFYCFWGQTAQNFSKNICKSDNFLLTCTHPAAACYRNTVWECDNFKTVNKKLEEIGKTTIKW